MDAAGALGEDPREIDVEHAVWVKVSLVLIMNAEKDGRNAPPHPTSRITSSFCGSNHCTTLVASLGTNEAALW